MAIFDLLREFLKKTPAHSNDITLSFDQINQILGRKLPATANNRQQWWGNQTGHTHSQAMAWRAAGFKVGRAKMDKRWVRFERI
jgi:hypothetical protein